MGRLRTSRSYRKKSNLLKEEQSAFLATTEGPFFDLVQQSVSEHRVLHDFALNVTDIMTGATEPADVIWLKEYFKRAGRLAALRTAIEKADPQLISDFDRIDGFDGVGPSDGDWLGQLAQNLFDKREIIENSLLQENPKEVLESFRIQKELWEWLELLKFDWLPKPPRWDLFLQALDDFYPLPDGLEEAIERAGIEQRFNAPAEAELIKICPKPNASISRN